VWWPRTLRALGRRAFARNYLQLNSIAAGTTLRGSFFTASADTPSRRRPETYGRHAGPTADLRKLAQRIPREGLDADELLREPERVRDLYG
jgi:hypothetical protein